jgi:hypothetical protein
VSKFRKKPVVIEARQWLPGDIEKAGDVLGWLMAAGQEHKILSGLGAKCVLAVRTLEGVMEASPGDYVIRGVRGEFYPCKPDIFEATYEPVTDDGATEGSAA